jgi:hypothetical protein
MLRDDAKGLADQEAAAIPTDEVTESDYRGHVYPAKGVASK